MLANSFDSDNRFNFTLDRVSFKQLSQCFFRITNGILKILRRNIKWNLPVNHLTYFAQHLNCRRWVASCSQVGDTRVRMFHGNHSLTFFCSFPSFFPPFPPFSLLWILNRRTLIRVANGLRILLCALIMNNIKLELWLNTKVVIINLGALSFMKVDFNWKLFNFRTAFAFRM